VNTTPPDSEVEDIARDLEHYIALHPTAADTLGGIARWWLTRSALPALDLVETALDALVGRGVLMRKPLPDGNFIYARAAPMPRPPTN
jgi:hypothetical protein